jgi:hypothetical protein
MSDEYPQSSDIIQPISRQVDNTQGSTLWAFNRFRSDVLTTLLNDLSRHEARGIDDVTCARIKYALSTLVNLSTALPDGGFLQRSVFDELLIFERRYTEWNAVERFDAPGRVRALKRLRESRKRLSNIIRRNQYVIQSELDLELIRSMYEAVENLVTALPSVLSGLGRVLERISQKLPEALPSGSETVNSGK